MARHEMEGRVFFGKLSMRVSIGSNKVFLFWTFKEEEEDEDEVEMILEIISPVFWSRMRSTPSIPPTANVLLSADKWPME